ncbi:uncharacterized protein LOC142634796 [Castanea sativa]|uniref:uncharacterized protein LOC142634796 n=1 Tax=Castanea sativa TaxID=21020 RepID=UPI003F64BDE1
MMLSRAGKEVLIKAVAQSIPTYTMSAFRSHQNYVMSLMLYVLDFGGDKLGMKGKFIGKCFKARYFPRVSILEATESPNCSFVWRSLVAALPILKNGHCWLVGDGVSVNVYRDRWFPNYPTNKLLLSVRDDEEEVMVSSLINHDLHVWRRDFIMENFNREEGEAICNIPLSRRRVPDSVYWKHSKDGKFTVKSAYKVARSLLEKEDWAEPSSGGGINKVWAAIWKLRIPNKIKVFGWRACHDILPTKRNLKKKRILSDESCLFCSRFQESTIHILWECTAAQDVWHGSARGLQKCGTAHTDFLALLEYLLDRLDKTEVELMVVQAWLIWNQRNRVVHGVKFLELGWLNKRAAKLLEEFQQSQEKLQAKAVHGMVRQVMQNDGTTVFEDNASSGFGVVIRNSRGEVMAAMTVKGHAVQCSEEAELLACRNSMEFATDAGFTSLVVEGDSINVARSIVSAKENQSAMGNIVGDIRHLMGALEWISVSCVKRNGNKVAHVLTRFAQHVSSDLFWMEEVPSVAFDFVNFDASLI